MLAGLRVLKAGPAYGGAQNHTLNKPPTTQEQDGSSDWAPFQGHQTIVSSGLTRGVSESPGWAVGVGALLSVPWHPVSWSGLVRAASARNLSRRPLSLRLGRALCEGAGGMEAWAGEWWN